MVRTVDWAMWRRTSRGFVRIVPSGCPRGHRWTQTGPGRPAERFVTCLCTIERHHTVWICPACGCYCAQGCLDTTLWAPSTAPVGLTDDLRERL